MTLSPTVATAVADRRAWHLRGWPMSNTGHRYAEPCAGQAVVTRRDLDEQGGKHLFSDITRRRWRPC